MYLNERANLNERPWERQRRPGKRQRRPGERQRRPGERQGRPGERQEKCGGPCGVWDSYCVGKLPR